VSIYYHGGVPGLGLGDLLLPPSKSGVKAGADYLPDQNRTSHVRRDRVYLGTDHGIGVMFAAMYPEREGGWIYEVEPIGTVEPDADWAGEPGVSVQVESARVVRVLGPLAKRDVLRVRALLMGMAS
jgi:hypothetical protein